MGGARSPGKFVICWVQGRERRVDRSGQVNWLLDAATRWMCGTPIRVRHVQVIGESVCRTAGIPRTVISVCCAIAPSVFWTKQRDDA